jgi:hypothetical protein
LETLKSAYDFSFYACFKWFQKQEEHPPSSVKPELYAWAVHSLNGTFLVSSIQSLLVLSGVFPAYTTPPFEAVSRIVLFGWPYPILLIVNFRYFIASGRWSELAVKTDEECSIKQNRNFGFVAFASVVLFAGSFWLAFKAL